MPQFSSQGASVELQVLSGHLLFIDPLYLDDIRAEYNQLPAGLLKESIDFVRLLEKRFFPYGGSDLLGYRYTQQRPVYTLDIRNIQFFEPSEKEQPYLPVAEDTTTFGVDSGALLILDLSNFEALVQSVTSEDLSDAEDNFPLYADTINQFLGNAGWAYIRCPGVDSGFDFIGSGRYQVTG